MTAVPIYGECDQRFIRVCKAFEKNFENDGELGAALSITLAGQPVVDLWGGYADKERQKEWAEDTIVNVYSTTKGMTAVCAHRLIDQGLLDLDEKVSYYWPEFAQAGKENIPVRYLMAHRAGLAAISKPLVTEDIFNWETMTSALAAQEPWWEPGTRHGYHALTFGWLVGEVVRRISGKSLGTYFREEVAEPLGLDIHIGLDDRHFHRVTDMIPAPPPPPAAEGEFNLAELITKDMESVTAKAFINPMMPRGIQNTPEWRRAEIPAANGHCSARSLARFYGALSVGGELDGVRVLSPESIERARTEQVSGPDQVLFMESRFGLGFMLPWPIMGTFLKNPRSFGHAGAGGSFAWADPEAGLGFGYVMNKMDAGLAGDVRAASLLQAMYESV